MVKQTDSGGSRFSLPAGGGRQKRPYSKPQILHHEPLEAVAADCSVPGGKSDPTCIVGFS